MEQNPSTSLFSLNLDAQNSYTLRSAASWAKVLGVCGLIMGILFLIAGILAQQAINSYGGSSYYRSETGFSARTLGNAGLIVYALMGIIFIVSSIFALNAGNKISSGLKANDMATLNSGFAGARNYFAFWAIMMIIMLVFMLIGVMGSL